MTDPIAAAEAAIAADAGLADPALWITRLPDAAIRARAAELAAQGPQGRALFGWTVAVKDNIDLADTPTTAGCPAYAYQPAHSAPAVQCLLDAGAIIIGKTNLDQFATGLAGVRSPYGVPRNLFDPARVPGGSSSGSAVAVAAGIVRAALGTDTAGSGRVPAMFGNIVGLKPTRGSISARGTVPACRSLDTISVFARSVDDALALARVIAGPDAEDPHNRAAPYPHLRRGGAMPQARIACASAEACDPEVAALYLRACMHLGARKVEIAPFLAAARLLYEGPYVAERTAALRDMLGRSADQIFPVTRAILQAGLALRTIDAFPAFDQVARARALAAELFRHHDALLLPTAPGTPTLEDLAADPIGANSRLGTYTNFANLCDLAGWAVPIGLDSSGLPVGAMLLGPAWSEGRLAGIADALHRAFATHAGRALSLPPAAPADPLGPEETGLFCIGAHMSGLPLNHQISGRGGRLVGTARTLPLYRLYDLGPRPGLLRTETGGGAIEGEIWALPQSAIGALLAEVTAPLGFGTVALEEGSCLGFLAESSGVAGAPDITATGGWRNWLASK